MRWHMQVSCALGTGGRLYRHVMGSKPGIGMKSRQESAGKMTSIETVIVACAPNGPQSEPA